MKLLISFFFSAVAITTPPKGVSDEERRDVVSARLQKPPRGRLVEYPHLASFVSGEAPLYESLKVVTLPEDDNGDGVGFQWLNKAGTVLGETAISGETEEVIEAILRQHHIHKVAHLTPTEACVAFRRTVEGKRLPSGDAPCATRVSSEGYCECRAPLPPVQVTARNGAPPLPFKCEVVCLKKFLHAEEDEEDLYHEEFHTEAEYEALVENNEL